MVIDNHKKVDLWFLKENFVSVHLVQLRLRMSKEKVGEKQKSYLAPYVKHVVDAPCSK